jgi:hypothetical protein
MRVRARPKLLRGSVPTTNASATGVTRMVLAVLDEPPTGSPRLDAPTSASMARRQPGLRQGNACECKIENPFLWRSSVLEPPEYDD